MANKTDNATNEVLFFIYRNRRILFLTGVLAGIFSIAISFALPVLYESNSIVFPAATSTVSFNSQRNVKAGPMDFGEEDSAEQLIQILESSPMRQRIIEKFNLAEVYEIDKNDARFNYKLKKKYESRIRFNRTRYGSINIAVLDKSPDLAAEIANTIVELIDTLKNDLIKERTAPAFEINQRKLDKLMQQQNALNIEMDSLARMGVIDAKSRSELYSGLNEAKNQQDRAFFKEQIEINQKYGARYDALEDLRRFRIEKLTDQEQAYEQAESDATESFNQKFVVETAYPSDKKAKPKKAIIVIISTFATVALMFIGLLIQDRLREIKMME